MENKVGAACQDQRKQDNCTKDKEDRNKGEKVSPVPEWNENIQKVIVGYH